MKKGIILILLFALCMSGCTSKEKSNTDITDTNETVNENTAEVPEIQTSANTDLETEYDNLDTREETEVEASEEEKTETQDPEELTTLTFALPEGDTLVEKLTLDVPSNSDLLAYYYTNMDKNYYSGEKVNQRISIAEWMSNELEAIEFPPNGYTISSKVAYNIRIRAYPTAEPDKYIEEVNYAHENDRTVNVIEDSGEANGYKYEFKYVEATKVLEDGTDYNFTCYYTLNDEVSLIYEIYGGTDAANPEDIVKEIANEIKLK